MFVKLGHPAFSKMVQDDSYFSNYFNNKWFTPFSLVEVFSL